MRDPRRAYRVVDAFEDELCAYTGAPFAIAVNSATNAIFLSLTWERMQGLSGSASVPRRTYVGVLQSVLNAGFDVVWDDRKVCDLGWYGFGDMSATVDSARYLAAGMYAWDVKGWPTLKGTFTCLSMHAAKQLPLGRGGAILTDNEEAAEWFLAARMDGRPPGQPVIRTVFPAWHMPMPPDVAARGLDVLSRWNDAGWSPPPLPPTDYPDLSLIYPREGVTV